MYFNGSINIHNQDSVVGIDSLMPHIHHSKLKNLDSLEEENDRESQTNISQILLVGDVLRSDGKKTFVQNSDSVSHNCSFGSYAAFVKMGC